MHIIAELIKPKVLNEVAKPYLKLSFLKFLLLKFLLAAYGLHTFSLGLFINISHREFLSPSILEATVLPFLVP